MGLFDWLERKSGDRENISDADDLVSVSKALSVPALSDKDALKLGVTIDSSSNYSGLYLPEEERSTHLYILGSSGVGKSKGLATWILDDIKNKRGVGVIDPHGDLIRDVVGSAGPSKNLILVEFTDPDYIVGFNPLEVQEGIDPFTQTLELVEVFRKIWNLSDDSTPRLLEILRNAVYTLIESVGTMLDIEPLLTNREFRDERIKYVTNEAVVSFWRNRFDKWKESDRISHVESTLNKVSTFTSDPRMRLMLSAKKSSINFRRIMDEEKTILINLSKGVLRTSSFLLGALFVAKIQMAAMSRQELPPAERKPFYFYVDEFQNYTTFSFAEILSEARKYGLSLILAHQSLVQLNEQLRSIILGNAKNFVIFRIDRVDAELLVKYLTEYDPYSVKLESFDETEFFGVNEQWEMGISELTNLSNQIAILKTKGCSPQMFRTYDLADTDTYEVFANVLREQNRKQGHLLPMKVLDDQLMLRPTNTFILDEPEEFVE